LSAPTHDPAGGAVAVPADLGSGPDAGPYPREDLRWWREIALIVVFYGVYTAIRDLRGTRPVSVGQAFHNARRVVGFERRLGLFHEAQIQRLALHDHFVVRLLDDWYGSTHFVVTAAVLAVLFFAHPSRYRHWRNALALATGLALIGFAFFPLMPPRLLPPGYGFTDTLQVVGGLWSFDSGPMTHLSNQYAAMPSLHFAWALWSGAALFSVARRLYVRLLAVLYPAVTLVCVIVTANHYFTDTAAGAAIVGVGYLGAKLLERRSGTLGKTTAGWSSDR
jgi:PAP2 superfamily